MNKICMNLSILRLLEELIVLRDCLNEASLLLNELRLEIELMDKNGLPEIPKIVIERVMNR